METGHVCCRDSEDDERDDDLEEADEPDPLKSTGGCLVSCIYLQSHCCVEKEKLILESKTTITARFDNSATAGRKWKYVGWPPLLYRPPPMPFSSIIDVHALSHAEF